MNGGGPELGTRGANEEEGPRGACPATPCNRGQGPAAEDSDSSDGSCLRQAARTLDERARARGVEASRN
eukprot:1356711-Alexandrium_andersonii.AAC.1